MQGGFAGYAPVRHGDDRSEWYVQREEPLAPASEARPIPGSSDRTRIRGRSGSVSATDTTDISHLSALCVRINLRGELALVVFWGRFNVDPRAPIAADVHRGTWLVQGDRPGIRNRRNKATAGIAGFSKFK